MTLPERIDQIRRYGIAVSDDGFTATPTGPVHIDDSEMCRVLLAHGDLLAACKALLNRELDVIGSEESPFAVDDILVNQARSAIALAEGGEA